MGYYWESHAKYFDGKRLAWFGDAPDEDFWDGYWQQKLTQSHYDALKTVRLADSVIGRILASELRKDDCILEAGCGAGSWVAILNHHGYANTVGIEYSPGVIEAVRRVNPHLKIHHGNALDTAYPDNSYDAYLSFGVIEHRQEGPEPFLKEAFRVLKPGGKAIITVPCVGPLRKIKARVGRYRDQTHGRSFFQYAFQRGELAALLKAHGLDVQYARYFELDRLWIEEVKIYRWLAKYDRLRSIEKKLTRHLEGIDGHMILMVARKPEGATCAE